MDPLLLRFMERISIVLIGGLAIYLGYRLFLQVPEHRDSAGKVTFPWDLSIAMTRIGPGVFFALFGTIAVGLSFIKPLEINTQHTGDSNIQGSPQSIRYMGSQRPGDKMARADARALLRKEMAGLNTIPRLLSPDLPQHDRDDIKRHITRVKVLLMKPVWGDSTEGFGDIKDFERWVEAREPNPPPAGMEGALALYHYGTKEPSP